MQNILWIKRLGLICFLFLQFPLHSNPDLTIIGYIIPEDGLGKIPINVLEALGSDVSANIRCLRAYPNEEVLPPSVLAALHNPDQSDGKVVLTTVGLWHMVGGKVIDLPHDSIIKIAYSMFETTRIPNMWVKILNEEFDAVVVPDKYLLKVYERCGVDIPIFVLPIPMRLDSYYDRSPHAASPSAPFVFGDASANKNPSILIKGFAKAFGNSPDVQLHMRACSIRPENYETMRQLIDHYGLTNVYIEEGDISLSQYIDRLASYDCYVNLSRGEGFSFIPREALALGLPVIITDNTASTTICDSGFVRPVRSTRKVPPLVHYKWVFGDDCGQQFDCEVQDVAKALLDVYEHYDKYIKKAREGRKWVSQYDCTNRELRRKYRTLVKPKKVLLGNKNVIGQEVIITNSAELYKKYLHLLE